MMQCAILCGGLGTRLGSLTADTPKPLLAIDGQPFLETLIFELGRQGIRKVLLLAAFQSQQVEAFVAGSSVAKRFGMKIEIAIEPDRAGTGGALWHARDLLEDRFFLLNGDTWFDVPILSLWSAMEQAGPDILGAVALRHVDDASRYGSVTISNGLLTGFVEKRSDPAPGYMNGGVYCLSKDVVGFVSPQSSLEVDLLAVLARKRRLLGLCFDQAYFIDIGIPETYNRAQTEIPARRRRPAAFLDRDGVINEDLNYVGSRARLRFMSGAASAVARLNRAGYYVFVVTNQAGIGHGFYSEEDHLDLMLHIAKQFGDEGAYIDDHRYCPFHPEAKVSRYRGAHPWRKPLPGMFLDLMAQWPIDLAGSFVIGDRETDLAAGAAVGVRGYLFSGGNLDMFIARILSVEARLKILGQMPLELDTD